ncbi:hypothetical protein BJ508DRAFT_309593 [Ascobolus immersus RN42]|uniref:Uncharacterized protein n=1 Tax=Ascobolus immersus RN42 TaxID=1160509 RepID=A0A3N4HWR8_ASCIM|nr:hypothetical protein BJ508DRAFT_309593 [Ascobolus immersus RN42]
MCEFKLINDHEKSRMSAPRILDNLRHNNVRQEPENNTNVKRDETEEAPGLICREQPQRSTSRILNNFITTLPLTRVSSAVGSTHPGHDLSHHIVQEENIRNVTSKGTRRKKPLHVMRGFKLINDSEHEKSEPSLKHERRVHQRVSLKTLMRVWRVARILNISSTASLCTDRKRKSNVKGDVDEKQYSARILLYVKGEFKPINDHEKNGSSCAGLEEITVHHQDSDESIKGVTHPHHLPTPHLVVRVKSRKKRKGDEIGLDENAYHFHSTKEECIEFDRYQGNSRFRMKTLQRKSSLVYSLTIPARFGRIIGIFITAQETRLVRVRGEECIQLGFYMVENTIHIEDSDDTIKIRTHPQHLQHSTVGSSECVETGCFKVENSTIHHVDSSENIHSGMHASWTSPPQPLATRRIKDVKGDAAFRPPLRLELAHTSSVRGEEYTVLLEGGE